MIYKIIKNGAVNISQLIEDISIATGLDMSGFDGTCGFGSNLFVIDAKLPITQSNIDKITTTVANHNPIYAAVKTFKLTGNSDVPINEDFRLFGLFCKEIFSTGWLVRKEYYKSYNASTNVYSDLVLTDEYMYTTNSAGFVSYRDEIIKWYLVDDTIGEVKSIRKYYNLQAAIAESITRRKNILDEVKTYGLINIPGIALDGITLNAYDFMLKAELSGTVRLFEQGIKQPLKDWVLASNEVYLTQTVKEGIIAIIS
jgi:hypothetical protein